MQVPGRLEPVTVEEGSGVMGMPQVPRAQQPRHPPPVAERAAHALHRLGEASADEALPGPARVGGRVLGAAVLDPVLRRAGVRSSGWLWVLDFSTRFSDGGARLL